MVRQYIGFERYGLSDENVLAILAAKRGRWSKGMTVDELFQSLGIEAFLTTGGLRGLPPLDPQPVVILQTLRPNLFALSVNFRRKRAEIAFGI